MSAGATSGATRLWLLAVAVVAAYYRLLGAPQQRRRRQQFLRPVLPRPPFFRSDFNARLASPCGPSRDFLSPPSSSPRSFNQRCPRLRTSRQSLRAAATSFSVTRDDRQIAFSFRFEVTLPARLEFFSLRAAVSLIPHRFLSDERK
jgi:hypothetical protein